MKTLRIILLMVLWLTSAVNYANPAIAGDSRAVLEAAGSSNLINDWIIVDLKIIRGYKIPMQHMRQMAYTGIALYESIVAGDLNYKSLAGQLNGYRRATSLPDSKDICWLSNANSAFATMLRFLYPQDPADVSLVDSMENVVKQRLIKEGYNEASVKAGSDYGTLIAQAVIDWSKTDGADKANNPYQILAGKGLWEPTPPKFDPPINPYMGNCRTLIKGSIDNSIPPHPPAFSTDSQSPFYKMVDEVYKASLQLDDNEKATGLFWDDYPDGKTVTAAGHWSSILKTVMTDRHCSLIEGAMLYAALFITENDANIGCFKAKYMYNQVRPVTYIQKFMNHPEWTPLIVTPSHPEYPAAHATISMSGATILTHLLGNQVSFTDDTYAYRGYKPHHFNNFMEAGREAGLSRFYGGIHYTPSIEAGYNQGQKVADNIAKALVFKN